MAQDLNIHFSKEDIQMEKKKKKKHHAQKDDSTLLIIREMKIKTAVRYHFTLVRMVIIKIVHAGDSME